MNYAESVKDITSVGKFHINLGLERITELLDLLGNPQDGLKCIQVAGTNGKGSVCSILYSVLKEAGYKTGLYTSPHIFDYTERIKIGQGTYSKDISKSDFSEYYSLITNLANQNNIKLTEFEILTAMMFKYFSDNNVDIAVIETGLGGRFDATNVLRTNLCSVITHIDLDHTDRLGDTKDKIAFEKSGIIKPESVVITSEGYEVIKDKSNEMNSLFVLTSPFVQDEFINALPLKGEHQKENLALAISAINTVFKGITDTTIINGLRRVKNPCRFQYIKSKNLIVDGAHNPNCFQALRTNLDRFFYNTKKQYVFGCLNTKDYRNMLKNLLEDATDTVCFYPYHFDNKNACSYESIKSVIPDNIEVGNFSRLDDILRDDVLTVVCGSFYMLDELLTDEIKNMVMVDVSI